VALSTGIRISATSFSRFGILLVIVFIRVKLAEEFGEAPVRLTSEKNFFND